MLTVLVLAIIALYAWGVARTYKEYGGRVTFVLLVKEAAFFGAYVGIAALLYCAPHVSDLGAIAAVFGAAFVGKCETGVDKYLGLNR